MLTADEPAGGASIMNAKTLPHYWNTVRSVDLDRSDHTRVH